MANENLDTRPMPFAHCWIVGKVTERRKTKDGKAKLLIVSPAPDPYSHPTVFEVSADTPFANVDDLVEVTARMSTFGKSYDRRDEFGAVTKERAYIFFMNYVSHKKLN